jgi:hypothetical protein
MCANQVIALVEIIIAVSIDLATTLFALIAKTAVKKLSRVNLALTVLAASSAASILY